MKCPACSQKNQHAQGCPYGPVDVPARLAEIDAWAGTVNARLAALEAPGAYPDGAPAGVVSPHVKANLEAIAEWCQVGRWASAEDVKTFMLAQVTIAAAGGDVDRPPRPPL